MREPPTTEDNVAPCPQILINVSCEGWPNERGLQNLVRDALSSITVVAGLNYPADAELSLLFCDDAEIAKINRQFRNLDKPTNVLSFPDQELLPGEPAGLMLGDIAFALQTVINEANFENKAFEHHLAHLSIHGFLHLFGYDHMNDEDAKIMESLETCALRNLDIDDPYCELPKRRKNKLR